MPNGRETTVSTRHLAPVGDLEDKDGTEQADCEIYENASLGTPPHPKHLPESNTNSTHFRELHAKKF